MLCAHFLSDFVFQTDCIYKGKAGKSTSGLLYQLLHSSTHATVTYLIIADWSAWFIPIVILISHFIIDSIKYSKKNTGIVSFLIDQLIHISIIVIMWWLIYGNSSEICGWFSTVDTTKMWVIITAYILMLKPSSVTLSLFLKQWTPSSDNSHSLPKAGQWIGYLERILTLTFILTGSLEGVGFLLAAKSVFRFGELNKAKDIRTTEYVLIGTMSSFAIAILIGIAVTFVI